MRLKLVQVGEEVLRQRARELSADEIRSPEIQQLIDFMHETLRDAPGVGLAAPQVGLGIQLAVIEDLPEYSKAMTPEQVAERERKPVPFHVIINPKLTPIGEEKVEFFEGCLSVNGYTALVPRFRRIRVECLDENAKARTTEASGWYARILQHEIDHLHGTVYVDRMHSRSLMTIENFTRRWKDRPVEEVRLSLGLSKVVEKP
ncbi:MAG TPA: peptide deformylase [Terriglobales bacterium]|nr:peptide deformylase [Terriglobales bacterium]